MCKYKALENFSKYMVCADGYLLNLETGDWLYGATKKTGYKEVAIRDDDGKRCYFLIHRLIANAFCEKSNDKQEVNHINGDKTDNRAENLEWVLHADNLKHAYESGLRKDDVSPKSVIATNMETGEQLTFKSIYRAARFLNISQGNICMCCKGLRPYAGGYYWEYEVQGGNENE